MSRRFALGLLTVVMPAAAALAANLPAPVQITLSDDGYSQSWSGRISPTSGGKILFVMIDDELNTTDDPVILYDGSFTTVQPTVTNEDVNTTVFGLGSTLTPGNVIGGWRRNSAEGGYGNVSVNGASPSTVTLNPEAVSIRDGCVFMVLQVGGFGNAFQINPSTGGHTQLNSSTYTVGGALRIHGSKCRAVWTYWNGDNVDDKYSLGYWDGSQERPLEFETDAGVPIFVDGKLVYTKEVAGVPQVFYVDTDEPGDPVPIQISNETDPNASLEPQTDGRHIVWYRSVGGSNAQLIVNGGFVFPTPALERLHFTERPFQLDRGQLLWKTATGTFQYDNGRDQYDLDPSPTTNAKVLYPWLTDGYIVFLAETPTSGTDDEVFRVTATPPLAQPQPPLLVVPSPGSAEVRWDPIIGATSYNAYVAYEPGVTKDNYATLTGGRKIENVSSPFHIPGIPQNTTYYVAITAVESGTEGPSSRVGSTTFIGPMQWNSVGGLSGTEFFSITADRLNSMFAYAGAAGSVYRSADGGSNWTEMLTAATTGSTRVRGIAAASPRVYVNTNRDDIWLSVNDGGNWTREHDGTGNGNLGSLLIEPANFNGLWAGNFDPANSLTHSQVIRSANAGDNWTHTSQLIEGETPREVQANALAAAGTTVFAGGNTTPNVAKTTDGGATWTRLDIVGGGQVNSLSVDPANANIIYASTRDKGVFKTIDGGTTWLAKNNGLAGVVDDFFGGAEFNSIIVDPQNSNLIHLGAGNGYWYSIDGAENWIAANDGLNGAWIYALAMTSSRRLLAATGDGIYMMSFATAPAVSSVSPDSGHTGGGETVTITGTGFQAGATVTFGDATVAASVIADTIVATAPAHSAGTVDIIVNNPDFQSGTLEDGFTYTNTPNIPSNVNAKAQSETSVLVTWNAAGGATSYQVWRKAPGTDFVLRASPTTTSHTDAVSPHTSYVYRVRAVNASGSSDDSTADIATSMLFTDDPLTTGTLIRIEHLAEQRMAIDHVRTLAGLGAAVYPEPAVAGLTVRATQITQMRTALDEAMTQLGLFAGGWFQFVAAGQPIRAFDFQEIRLRVQ